MNRLKYLMLLNVMILSLPYTKFLHQNQLCIMLKVMKVPNLVHLERLLVHWLVAIP